MIEISFVLTCVAWLINGLSSTIHCIINIHDMSNMITFWSMVCMVNDVGAVKFHIYCKCECLIKPTWSCTHYYLSACLELRGLPCSRFHSKTNSNFSHPFVTTLKSQKCHECQKWQNKRYGWYESVIGCRWHSNIK